MALFSNLFQKLYVGKDKDDLTVEDMPKNRFGLFGEALGTRVGLMIRTNFLYLVFILPLIVWTVHNCTVILNAASAAYSAGTSIYEAAAPYVTVYLLGLIPCMALAGPPTAGLNYLTREFARDEHVWLWSDFKDAMKNNWKQSAVLMTIYGLVLLMFWLANGVYSSMASGNMFFGVLQWVLVVIVALIEMSSIYTLPMCITFDMKLGEIFRSGLYVCVGKLPTTLLFSFLALLPSALLLVLTAYWSYGILILIAYLAVWGFAFNGYLLNAYTNSVFAKYTEADTKTSGAGARPADKDEPDPEDLL